MTESATGNKGTKEVILVAEDSPPNRKILSHLLKKLNYDVIECEDGFILLRSDQGFTCVTSQDQNMAYDETLLDNLLKSSGVVVGNKNSACEAIWAAAPKSVNSLLATSLEVVDEQAQAAIGLINKLNHHFTAGDTKLLAALAQQVAVII